MLLLFFLYKNTKYELDKHYILCVFAVAPFMGAWIEMNNLYMERHNTYVAPFMGSWIEIHNVQ